MGVIDGFRVEQKSILTLITELTVSKRVLESDNLKLQREIEELQQYSRCNNIEITGLSEVKGEDDEVKVLTLLSKKLNCKVTENDIEACNRVQTKRKDKMEPIVVRFVNRKVWNKIFNSRKSLRSNKDVKSIH